MTSKKEGPIQILASRSSETILSFLWEKWQAFNQGKDSSPATTFKKLEEVIGVSPRTLNTRLRELVDLGLIDRKGRNYSISSAGILSYPLLRKIEMIQPESRVAIEFDQRKDSRAWPREADAIISGTNKELLITTRRLASLLNPQVFGEVYPLFKGAANRRVKIRVIADPSISKEAQETLINEFKGELKFINSEFLENPPGILKPVFLDDICHMMIADRTHWLALRPHKSENEHSGQRCLEDPVTAEYLAEIFETLWMIADYLAKGLRESKIRLTTS